MSTLKAHHPTQEAVIVDDAPYSSSLLRYNTELKQTSTVLAAMRAVFSNVIATERASIQSLIQSTDSLYRDASLELESLLKRMEVLIRYEYDKPGRTFESHHAREVVEMGLVSLRKAMTKLALQTDELEDARLRLLQPWGTDGSGTV